MKPRMKNSRPQEMAMVEMNLMNFSMTMMSYLKMMNCYNYY
jgi:hypothetical protein